MNIQYISDIHLELLNEPQQKYIINLLTPDPHTTIEVLILAGDIGNPFQTIYDEFLSIIHPHYKKIFIVAGNHEYYYNDIIETNRKIQRLCDNYDNIWFLNNSTEDYGGFRFIGTTLWSLIKNGKPTINDVRVIKNFTIEKYNSLHRQSVEFLENTLEQCHNDNIKAIVITHHLPFDELIHENYKNSEYNQWFSSNLIYLIEPNRTAIHSWVYGHTHTQSIHTVYGIDFYCNPLGYKGENDITQIHKVFQA